MGQASEYIWYLKFQISVKDRQLEAFRNGHKYASLRADFEAVCSKLKKRIHELESELSKAHAPFPDGYTTDICYDQSVKAFVYLLANEGNMAVAKIRKILREASHGTLDISEATINDLCSEFAKKSKPEKDKIIADIMTSPVANIDFTNANVNGDAKQVLIIASPSKNVYLYVARDKKGHEGIKGTPAENYVGIFVHDHDTTFYSYGMGHQECGQHIGRYLTGSEENEPNLKWNLQMHELYREMTHHKNNLCGDDADPDVVANFEKRYDEILNLAKEEYENEPSSDYYREGYNLYRRLEKYKIHIYCFCIIKMCLRTTHLRNGLPESINENRSRPWHFEAKGSSLICVTD